MENLIITISRAYGSGGAMIGKQVAQMLDIAYYDRESLDKIAHERGQDKVYITNWQRSISDIDVWGATNPVAHLGTWSYWKTGSPYYFNEKVMFEVQSKIMRELAEKASGVFVGRCADYVLKDRQRRLHIWIGADDDRRMTRLYDDYLIRNGDLLRNIRLVDKGRAAYYERRTGQLWGEHYNYHLHIDSGTLGIAKCCQVICSAAEQI